MWLESLFWTPWGYQPQSPSSNTPSPSPSFYLVSLPSSSWMWDEFSLPTNCKLTVQHAATTAVFVSFPHLSWFLLCSLRDGALSLKMSLQQNFSPTGQASREQLWCWGSGGGGGGGPGIPARCPHPHLSLVHLWAQGKGGGEEREEKGAEVTLVLHPSQAASAARGWGIRGNEHDPRAGSAQGERTAGPAARLCRRRSWEPSESAVLRPGTRGDGARSGALFCSAVSLPCRRRRCKVTTPPATGFPSVGLRVLHAAEV